MEELTIFQDLQEQIEDKWRIKGIDLAGQTMNLERVLDSKEYQVEPQTVTSLMWRLLPKLQSSDIFKDDSDNIKTQAKYQQVIRKISSKYNISLEDAEGKLKTIKVPVVLWSTVPTE